MIVILKNVCYTLIISVDELNDGERVYIVDNAIDLTHNATSSYNNKKVYMKSIHYIVNRECVVKNNNGEKINNYISGLLEKFDFIRLLGDEPLQDDEN